MSNASRWSRSWLALRYPIARISLHLQVVTAWRKLAGVDALGERASIGGLERLAQSERRPHQPHAPGDRQARQKDDRAGAFADHCSWLRSAAGKRRHHRLDDNLRLVRSGLFKRAL